MNYSIYIKYQDNTGAYLSVNGRTEWKGRTAKKHLKEIIIDLAKNSKWSNVRYFAIVAV